MVAGIHKQACCYAHTRDTYTYTRWQDFLVIRLIHTLMHTSIYYIYIYIYIYMMTTTIYKVSKTSKGPLHKFSYLDQKLVTPLFSANFTYGHPIA